ncbi:MAG: phosphoenolpyruvate carboxykinase (ATP) [Deltaproteobacteria bacterium]|nr:phosphoenolpyruvate carboxykinase (ATP) [Deltaproteobacteria bacterium]
MSLNPHLKPAGFSKNKAVFWGLTTSQLTEEAIKRGEGVLADQGPLVITTGKHTGRSAEDKFIVRDTTTEKKIWWDQNKPFSSAQFEQLRKKVIAHLENKDVFVQDCFVGADPKHQYSVRVINEAAWHNIFVRNMFFRQTAGFIHKGLPKFTILHAPSFKADPKTDGTRSETFIILNFTTGTVLIGGTGYAGEVKKSVFTLLNFCYPDEGIFPMHSSINIGKENDTAVFFGLSGTGKTTLSADPDRVLIGDDEHGWGPNGTFNFEGGCYAKVINLSAKTEPEIYATTQRFGTILENVVLDPNTRMLDLNSNKITENTRGSYPIDFIPNASSTGIAGHPKHIVMLTADAFGVLPPVSQLTTEQAMYHFISGYTAKVAGTEIGIKEPKATFSTCFGAPFMPRPSSVYAHLLGQRMKTHHSCAWLINTGWIGGSYGVGSRISLPYTRAILKAIFSGQLNDTPTEMDPFFNLRIPKQCPDVPNNILNPRISWKDKNVYDTKAKELAKKFIENFKKFNFEELAKHGPYPK